MTHSRFFLFLVPVLLLASCASKPAMPSPVALKERLGNPLIAERYWSDMAEHMAEFTRRKDPILKNVVKAGIIEHARLQALDKVAEARSMKKGGRGGMFLNPTLLEEVQGEALVLPNALYFGPTFATYPSPTLHVMLTDMLDPRDGKFPDASAVDLGPLQSSYGAQTYPLKAKKDLTYQAAVLYDTDLERMVGFAQLVK